MKSKKILGIYRLPLFSNNAIEADRLILEESIARLRTAVPNLDITFLEESEASTARNVYDLVLTMAQSEETLKHLEQTFPEHLVWNSSAAIRNCYRLAMSNKLIALNVGYVPFQVIHTEAPKLELLPEDGSYWLKRSDFHAIADEDVSLAEGKAEIQEKIARFKARGVKEVLLQQHIHGDIYKFYGVKDHFFRPIKVRDFLNGNHAAPDMQRLQAVVEESANALGLLIYGGDCVLDSSGKFHLIDLNDWPSFRLCRPEAAQAIADLALKKLNLSLEETTAVAAAHG